MMSAWAALDSIWDVQASRSSRVDSVVYERVLGTFWPGAASRRGQREAILRHRGR